MRIINKKYLLIILLAGVILTGIIILKPTKEVKLDNVVLKQELDKKSFAMYIKNDDEYEAYEGTKFPEGYDLDLNESKCIDNNGQEIEDVLSYKNGEVTITSGKTTYCYLYFYLPEEKEFEYTGNYQVFIAPKDGNYEIELWGASGGDEVKEGAIKDSAGRGAYTKGSIELEKQEKLYVFIGENPTEYGRDATLPIFNGGGYGESPGGGATDVRLNINETGDWNNFDSLKSRIMVAAGGGGGVHTAVDMTQEYKRGDGGTINGLDAHFYVSNVVGTCSIGGGTTNTYEYSGHGATQTSGGTPGTIFGCGIDPQEIPEMTGKFGSGGYGKHASNAFKYTSSGGGGGYYGGGHGNHPGGTWTGGGGGSSFISGYEGCIAIDENSTEDNIKHLETSIHYSGKIFTDTIMLAGNESMPTYDGQDTMIGNTGNGHAKIKLVQ